MFLSTQFASFQSISTNSQYIISQTEVAFLTRRHNNIWKQFDDPHPNLKIGLIITAKNVYKMHSKHRWYNNDM